MIFIILFRLDINNVLAQILRNLTTLNTSQMMNKILAILISFLLLNSCTEKKVKTHETTVIPKPTEPRKERKKIKKAFFENMHRAEEGFNRKEHNKQLRWKKYEEKAHTKAEIPVDGYWQERGSANQSGRIHTAELDTINNLLYCASSGGNIWKGNPEGENWESLNDELKFYNIKMLDLIQNDSLNRLVVCSGSSEFYYTDDSGLTWNQSTGLEGTIDWGHIRKSVVVNDSLKSVYVLTSEWDDGSWGSVARVYRSQNQGESFQVLRQFNTDVDRVDLWAPYHNSDTLFILSNKELHTLAPNQNTTVFRTNITSSGNGYSLLTGCSTENQTRLYAYINHKLHRSNDSGTTWEFITELEDAPFFSMSFNASITNPDYLYFGAVECHVSYDGGVNWDIVNPWGAYYSSPSNRLHADIPNIKPVLNSDGEELTYVSTDGGLYVSDDYLNTVQNIALQDLNVGQYYSVYTNRNNTNYIYAGAQDQGFQRSEDGDNEGPLNFDQVISGDYGHIVSTDGGASLWTVYPGFAHYYPDAEIGEGEGYWDFPEGATDLWLPPLMAHPFEANKAFLAGGHLSGLGSYIIRLNYNGAVTATQLDFNFRTASGGGYITAMAISPLNMDYWYVLTNNGKFFQSTDYGDTWTKTESFTGPENHYFYGASIQPSQVDLGKVYIAGSGYSNPGVYMTDDNGESFTAINEGLPSTMIYDIAPTPGDEFVFAATELGAYIYISVENKWEDLAADTAPDQIYWTVEFVDELKTARFGTYGRGIWDFNLEEETSSVGTEDHASPQQQFKLYPNPANNKIQLEFDANEKTIIEIYDMQGRLVMKQAVQNKTTQQLDISNLPKGAYICKIQTNESELKQQFIKD